MVSQWETQSSRHLLSKVLRQQEGALKVAGGEVSCPPTFTSLVMLMIQAAICEDRREQ